VDSPVPQTADRVRVLKAERRLLLFRGEQLLAAYRVALGSQPEGHKERRGDGRTPEGSYVLDWRQSESEFHRGIHISYPNAQDRARAAAAGVSPGGGVMIHGLPNGLGEIGADHAAGDWTKGCIAVTNEEMNEIWQAVPDGTPIEILP
jgi:murein L,D-transpeptidase YafK